MSRELKALDTIKNYQVCTNYGLDEYKAIVEVLPNCFNIVEDALKNQKRKLDLIGEVLVDVSKGNYTDLSDAIDEIREVL